MHSDDQNDPAPTGSVRDPLQFLIRNRLWVRMPYLQRRLTQTLDAAARQELDRALKGRDAQHAREVAKRLGVDLDGALEQLLEPAPHPGLERASRVFITYHRRATSPLVRPPCLMGTGILRRLLRPADYNRMVEPHIADMHEEYFACLARRDERGARWAVIRGNLYAVPSWVWLVVVRVIAHIIGWTRT